MCKYQIAYFIIFNEYEIHFVGKQIHLFLDLPLIFEFRIDLSTMYVHTANQKSYLEALDLLIVLKKS